MPPAPAEFGNGMNLAATHRLPSGSNLLGRDNCDEWLRSLPAAVHDAACIALSELTLVSADAYESAVRKAIDRIISSADSAVGLYCVRDVQKDGSGVPNDYHGSAVLDAVRTDEPGSDWRMAHLMFKLKTDRVLYHPTMEELRAHRVHDIVVADDVSTSGTNIGNFMSAFHQNSTLHSWYSHRLVRYHIVLHTLGVKAIDGMKEKLREHGRRQLLRRLPTIHCVRHDAVGFTDPSIAFFKETKRLLSAKHRNMWKGFKGSMGKTVFAHGCPNNLPAIFWDAEGSFVPLFPNGTVPAELLPAFTTVDLAKEGLPLVAHLGPLDQLALRQLAAGARSCRAVAGRTGLELRHARDAVGRLQNLGLLDQDLLLTADGRRAADALEKPERATHGVARRSAFYYRRIEGVSNTST